MVIAFAVVAGILAFFILNGSPLLSPGLGPDCDSSYYTIDQSDREFYGWDGKDEPQVGDFILKGCNDPDVRCLAKHNKLATDNSIYSVRLDSYDSRERRNNWEMSCSICQSGIICRCK